MADDDKIREIVERVTAQVRSEAAGYEDAFSVGALTDHLQKFSRDGLDSAWSISYTTAASEAELKRASDMAWSISYTTAASEAELRSAE
ncbi:hypothetical protein ABZ137_38500 [Streptomyces bobili]|uniref:hypothetical protein n=1 Tax=Streptomyces bobili TaxID=67280 RepID=UPI0033BE60A9